MFIFQSESLFKSVQVLGVEDGRECRAVDGLSLIHIYRFATSVFKGLGQVFVVAGGFVQFHGSQFHIVHPVVLFVNVGTSGRCLEAYVPGRSEYLNIKAESYAHSRIKDRDS